MDTVNRVGMSTKRKPAVVYYGWAPWADDASLVNGEGLPASTFKLNIP